MDSGEHRFEPKKIPRPEGGTPPKVEKPSWRRRFDPAFTETPLRPLGTFRRLIEIEEELAVPPLPPLHKSEREALVKESGADVPYLRSEFANARKALIAGARSKEKGDARVTAYLDAYHAFLFALLRGAESRAPLSYDGTRGILHAAFQARVQEELVAKEQLVLDELGIPLSLTDELRRDTQLCTMLGRDDCVTQSEDAEAASQKERLREPGVVGDDGNVVAALARWLPTLPENVLASLLVNQGVRTTLMEARLDGNWEGVARELALALDITDSSGSLIRPGDRFVVDGGGVSVYEHVGTKQERRVVRLTNQGFHRFGRPPARES